MRKAALFLVALGAAVYGLWRLSDAQTFQLFGEVVPRVTTTERVVALTFDDGPTPGYTDRVLALLRAQHVRATFFVTGGEAARHPEAARAIVRAGHELGNHSYAHRRMLLRPPGFYREEVERADAAIRAAGYEGPIHFRPPYGKRLFGLPLYLQRTGRTTIMWDVEPESYPEVGRSADRIVAHVLERVRPGSIVLLHVMYEDRAETMRAVPGIVEGLRQRGYRFVTVSELLALAE